MLAPPQPVISVSVHHLDESMAFGGLIQLVLLNPKQNLRKVIAYYAISGSKGNDL